MSKTSISIFIRSGGAWWALIDRMSVSIRICPAQRQSNEGSSSTLCNSIFQSITEYYSNTLHIQHVLAHAIWQVPCKCSTIHYTAAVNTYLTTASPFSKTCDIKLVCAYSFQTSSLIKAERANKIESKIVWKCQEVSLKKKYKTKYAKNESWRTLKIPEK